MCFQNYCPTQYLLLGFSRDTCKSIRSVSLTINEIVTARPNPPAEWAKDIEKILTFVCLFHELFRYSLI